MSRVEFTPTTLADIEAFAAICPDAKKIPPTRIIALTAKIDGRVLGIGGVAIYPSGLRAAFMDVSEEGRKYPIALHKAGLAALAMMKEKHIRKVYAEAVGHEAAERWLLRLGFEKVDGALYVANL